MSHGSHSFLRLITGNLNSIRFLGQFHRLANPSIHLLMLFFIHVCAIKKVLSLSCAIEERIASLIYSDEGRRDERKSKQVVSILSLNILLQIVCQAVLQLVKFGLSLLVVDLSLLSHPSCAYMSKSVRRDESFKQFGHKAREVRCTKRITNSKAGYRRKNLRESGLLQRQGNYMQRVLSVCSMCVFNSVPTQLVFKNWAKYLPQPVSKNVCMYQPG